MGARREPRATGKSGAFFSAQRAPVINDSDFLHTLPGRETVAGLSEAMRIALSEHASLFGWLRLHAAGLRACEQGEIRELLRRVVGHHLTRGGDPFDARLGLGRWAAHQLEVISDHELRYGEAMAIGLALDAVHSAACGALDTDALEPIIGTLQALGLATYHPALESSIAVAASCSTGSVVSRTFCSTMSVTLARQTRSTMISCCAPSTGRHRA